MRTRLILAAAAALAIGGALLAQMASTSQSVDVTRVGARLACQCGCADTVATCSMLGCSFAAPAKQRIMEMQSAGTSDDEIIQTFIREYGQGIFRGAPSSFGWMIPYALLAAGLALLTWFVMRVRTRPQPVAAPDVDPHLARYNEQIEKELSKLD
ncbi:MAG: cytochrome c-type biogenesis protein CcmH [Bryobacterales bacterium]|nr:cytochrome c-type biogenesis protein CcmH [Bryobacterales bacterium]